MGHLDASRLPEGYPQYFARAEGRHLQGVDGRAFVDLMRARGPFRCGPVEMPTLLFDGDLGWRRGLALCAEALRHGAYLHAKHDMFPSCAHTEADIDAVMEATDAGFRHAAR